MLTGPLLPAPLFAAMPSNRDRAILALDISTGARAAELLGIRGADIDWGDQLIRVRRKGTGIQQWLPASSAAAKGVSCDGSR